LQADDYKYISDYGEFEDTRISYEYAKLQALKNVAAEYGKNFYAVLQNAYEEYLSKEHSEIFLWQKKNKLFDRFDLSVLLSSYQKKYGEFSVEKEYYQELTNGSYRKKNGSFPVRYNLMIIDEFQNYLPEQLRILNSCLNERVKSVVYVGDLAQQTQLETIHSFESMGVSVGVDRVVKLQKVYRNTKEILSYIKKLGFDIEIPAQIKSGEKVKEITLPSIEKEIDFIADFLTKEKDGTIGVLARSKEYLKMFKIYFQNNSRVHVLSFYEAQGVEFDTVFVVGAGERLKSGLEKLPNELLVEIKKIENDLLYVGLTRAMSRLWVLERGGLEKIINKIV
jgi:superfamily I DNA/RNA helicase